MIDKENLFMTWIYNKPSGNIFKRIAYTIKFYRFLYSLNKVAPDFNMLWEISNFLKLLQIVYFYKHTGTEYMCHSITKDPNSDGFIIVKNGHQIKWLLSRNDSVITIEVRDIDAYKDVISRINFRDGEATIRDSTDREMFINLNGLIMNNLISLLKTYYKYKG